MSGSCGYLPLSAVFAFVSAVGRGHFYTLLTEIGKQECSSQLLSSPAPARKDNARKTKKEKKLEQTKNERNVSEKSIFFTSNESEYMI